MNKKLIEKRDRYAKQLKKMDAKIKALEKKYKRLEFQHYKTCVEIANEED